MANTPLVFWPRNVELTEVGQYGARFCTELGRINVTVVQRILARAVGARVPVRTDGERCFHAVPQRRLSLDEAGRLNAALAMLTIIRRTADDAPDFTMALDWYRLPGGSGSNTAVGELVFAAKRRDSESARINLRERLIWAVRHHYTLSGAEAVVAVGSTVSCSQELAEGVGSFLNVPVFAATKRAGAARQIQVDEQAGDFQSAFDAPRGNWSLSGDPFPSKVLVIDDVYSTGGTIAEVTRCLRTQGVNSVYALTAAKTATWLRQS